ncbi:helix-turn-helix domain-containing protein [Clostridium sp. SHJSY1]|uniref:transcriptional regulator n=1 Tax=Clostridium sp. SHJSY1 TaxID=2942483 RepID=UPI002874AFA1|nr:transcriptional regulator [Clostridium sp. SHJSY1]MDS0526083.1 helix-turn-helix domain-containing protein [Clostridium sp. SHJSY1]
MSYLTVTDVRKILGISTSKAYSIIRQLNNDLKSKGYIVISGRVPKKYFMEKYYCEVDELKQELTTM